MSIRLPLTLKVRDVRRSADVLEVESVVTDAAGVSVGAVPLSMHPKTSVSAACAMLQHHVKCMAESMLKNGRASTSLPEGETEDDSALIGREFSGSAL